ncbi:MAG: hypothetical protein K8T25_07395 [Planctomycetia bacterium]|nr:hypothetical protein [Planctomycetia bacterium]
MSTAASAPSPKARPILLLTDHRGMFWSSALNDRGRSSMKVDRLVEFFQAAGHTAAVAKAAEVAGHVGDYKDRAVLYTSAEDSPDYYRGFLEDVVLALNSAGAVLVPRFELLRAHHNKVFAEMYRQLIMGDGAGGIPARPYDVAESVRESPFGYPVVVKGYRGAGSRAVSLARSPAELQRQIRRISLCADSRWWLGEFRRRIAWRRYGYVPQSVHRRRFVLQQFVPGMSGDHKVLVHGGKFYVVRRRNRPGDFRASGSGLFEFAPADTDDRLLDYAMMVYRAFDVPVISLDIGFDGQQYRLIEYQCVMFGQISLEKSTCFFQHTATGWVRTEEKPDLEREFARSILEYIVGHPAPAGTEP